MTNPKLKYEDMRDCEGKGYYKILVEDEKTKQYT